MSKIFADANAKDGVVVLSFYVDDNSDKMTIHRSVNNFTGFIDSALLNSFTSVLNADPAANVTMVLPESAAIRALVVRAAVNAGNDAVEASLKDWMPQEIKNSLSVAIPALEEAIRNHTGSISVIKARCLYRWEIEAVNGSMIKELEKLQSGDEIELTATSNQGSIAKNKKIVCRENNYLNGKFTVSTRRTGQRTRYFVERLIEVYDESGKPIKTTTYDASSRGLEGTNDSANRVLNLLTLRTKTAEALPRTIRKTKVEVVA